MLIIIFMNFSNNISVLQVIHIALYIVTPSHRCLWLGVTVASLILLD